MHVISLTALLLISHGSLAVTAKSGAPKPESTSSTIEFNRVILPILSDKCFACHGPDKNSRKTALRFDTEEGAFINLGEDKFAIVRGQPDKSEMIRRISSDDEAIRMPPAYAGHAKLSEQEITLIRQWITQGAPWQKHWAFIPPQRPPLSSGQE